MLNRLLTGSAFLFAVRLGGAGIGFLTQILLARMLGSHELGLFYSVTSLAAVGGFVMSQGYSQIAYRFSARYRKEGKAFLFKKFVSRAAADALLASTAAAAIVVLCSYLLPDLDPSERMVWKSAIRRAMVRATCFGTEPRRDTKGVTHTKCFYYKKLRAYTSSRPTPLTYKPSPS